MTMLHFSVKGEIYADNHSFLLAEPGEYPSSAIEFFNGLVAVQSGLAMILTGVAMGPVEVTLELWDELPSVDFGDWDEIVEVSLYAREANVSLTGPEVEAPAHMPVVSSAGPGSYRLRVHARGRDENYDLAVRSPSESYLIQTCLGPSAPEVVIKATDQCGRDFYA
ncbi:hypothetical protein [Actinomadura madurae]|uniref:hypothetical protein n=1 Tax=Actinomadura madurae TaxID=1993 RepID=UPI0011606F3F|nr:hypothetical protein [Actinomadura madurae]